MALLRIIFFHLFLVTVRLAYPKIAYLVCQGWRLDIPEGEKMFKWWDPVYSWYRWHFKKMLLFTNNV